MTNLFKRFFTHKSKFLLIIISLLGLAFSYSCSCRDNPVAPPPETPEGNNVDPKFFTIYTNAVTNLLVQKASDTSGKSFTYQPSIKFREANNNGYKVEYEVTDNDTANKIEKANVTYNEKDGLITFDKTAVLDKLSADTKKTITITFNISATNSNLSNSTTNFTLKVDLKKTYGKLDPSKNIGELFVQASGFSPSLFGFTVQFKNPKTTDVSATLKALDDGKNKKEVEYNKKNFINSLKVNLKEEADKSSSTYKVTYKSMDLVNDEKGATGVWSFNFKFKFSDEDYDLTDEQKNGVDYRLDLTIGDANNMIDGSWIKFI